MLQDGYIIRDVLLICKRVFNEKRITSIEQMLHEGKAFEEAIIESAYPVLFIQFFTFFLAKNELHHAIDQSVMLCKKINSFKSMLFSKLKYPLFLLLFMLFFSMFVVYFLIPQVRELMVQFQANSSLFQDIIFSLFTIIPMGIIVVVLGLGSILLWMYYVISHRKSVYIHSLLSIRVIGHIVQKLYSVYFALFYNELLLSGYDTLEMMQFLNNSMNQGILQVVVYEMDKEMNHGNDFFHCLKECVYFEALFVEFIYLLEKENKGKKSLDSYLDISFMDIEQQINKFMHVIVPLIYGFVGSFVVFVYLAIILPLMDVIAIM